MSDLNESRIIIELPFDQNRNPVVISQGFDAPFSHNKRISTDLTHSLDFALNPGTPVQAVADGVIDDITKMNSCYRGFNPDLGRRAWATTIQVMHPQFNAFSFMQHLDPESIRVEKGQRVTRGQVLATTGLTGWVGPIPHLHLSMFEAGKYPFTSLPFDLRNYHGPLDDQSNEFMLSMYGSELANKILEAREQARRAMNV